jgi:hypothetical protein
MTKEMYEGLKDKLIKHGDMTIRWDCGSDNVNFEVDHCEWDSDLHEALYNELEEELDMYGPGDGMMTYGTGTLSLYDGDIELSYNVSEDTEYSKNYDIPISSIEGLAKLKELFDEAGVEEGVELSYYNYGNEFERTDSYEEVSLDIPHLINQAGIGPWEHIAGPILKESGGDLDDESFNSITLTLEDDRAIGMMWGVVVLESKSSTYTISIDEELEEDVQPT